MSCSAVLGACKQLLGTGKGEHAQRGAAGSGTANKGQQSVVDSPSQCSAARHASTPVLDLAQYRSEDEMTAVASLDGFIATVALPPPCLEQNGVTREQRVLENRY